jgi:hypothetical protein
MSDTPSPTPAAATPAIQPPPTAPCPTVVLAKRAAGAARLLLPNGMVGRDYRVQFQLGFELPGPVIWALSETAGLGLTWDATARQLHGLPSQAGDHQLRLTLRWPEDELCPHCRGPLGAAFPLLPPRQASQEFALQLTVNAHPQSLWKDLEVPADLAFPRPVAETRQVAAGTRRLLAASQRGRSHAHVGSPRDDAFLITHDETTGASYLLVADGAGSARYSRRGAELACTVALDHLRQALPPTFWDDLQRVIPQPLAEHTTTRQGAISNRLYSVFGNAVFAAHKAIRAEADKCPGSEPRDFATTLLAAVCKQVPGGWFVGAYWIGDGAIAVYREGQQVILLGTPDGGEYAGQTRFLTMPEVLATSDEVAKRISYAIVPDFTAVVAMTDGVSDPQFENDARLGQVAAWDTLWAQLRPLVADADRPPEEAAQQLLAWLGFWSPGNHDDRTIALLS